MFSHKITYKRLKNGKSDNIEMRFKAVIKGATLSIETVKTVFNCDRLDFKTDFPR